MDLQINLQDKRALVSGVSSGIGAGVARMLARAGCRVAGCGLEPAAAVERANEGKNEVRRLAYTSLDLTAPGAIEEWVASAAEMLGGIDLVVSNAGRNVFTGVYPGSDEGWAENISLNLTAHWRLARAAYPYLRQSGRGVMIIMASNHAYYTLPGCFPYNVAKAGLVAMVQSLAIEWGPAVRAVGIAPGFIDTAAGRAWFNTFADPAAELARTRASHPVNRIGSVEEIGALCAFLASDWGQFISGTTIVIDGGRSALMQERTFDE